MEEHSDPNSYSWCLMRYATVKFLRNSINKFLPQIGIELPGKYFFFAITTTVILLHYSRVKLGEH